MTDEVERIKLAGQIDISCVQAFHTLKEIDEMIEIAEKIRVCRGFYSACIQRSCGGTAERL